MTRAYEQGLEMIGLGPGRKENEAGNVSRFLSRCVRENAENESMGRENAWQQMKPVASDHNAHTHNQTIMTSLCVCIGVFVHKYMYLCVYA